MTDLIKVNFEAVYEKINELQAFIDQNILEECDTQHTQVNQMLRQVDGATNAELMTAMEMNKQKARLTAQTLQKLLAFMENAARVVEEEDRNLALRLQASQGEGA